MKSDLASMTLFTAPYAPDDGAIAARLLATAHLSAAQDKRIDRTAMRLIDAIRANDDRLGGVEDMLREFALSTKDGLALMVLAEALLRVPARLRWSRREQNGCPSAASPAGWRRARRARPAVSPAARSCLAGFRQAESRAPISPAPMPMH